METESLLLKPANHGGIKRYLRRRRYKLLDGDGGKKTKMMRLRRNPRRQWRIKVIPKLTWSPLKLMTKLKNAYMNFMLKSMTPDNIFGHKNISKPVPPQLSQVYVGDAFEARLIFEISKALVASHELYPI